MDYQKWAFMNSWDKQFVLWLVSRNGGKALSLDTPVYAEDRIKTIEEIKIGDKIYGNDGELTTVINISSVFHNHNCYKLTFSDGEEIIADENHLWRVNHIGKRCNYNIFNTKELYENGFYRERKDKKGIEYFYKIDINSPLNYSEKELKIHPYVLGLWLGDGNARDTRITSHVDDYNEINNYIRECGYNTSINSKYKNVYNINIGIIGKGKNNDFKDNLRKYNLLQNKHIPHIYMTSSISQRMELLRGLMDTDGTIYSKKNGANVCEFSQKDYNFIKQVSNLLGSLGIKNKIYNKKSKANGVEFNSYIIKFYCTQNNNCFKLKRKSNRVPANINKRNYSKYITNIEKVESVPTKCLMVDNKEHLFLCGEKYTITHNSTLSAPFAMAKLLLFPNFESYLLSLTAAQSQDTFLKMENIAKKQIESFTGLTDVFLGEVVSAANHDGFVHSPQGFRYSLYNGSKITSLSGEENNIRGKRSSLNIYDESGFISENYISTTKAFAAQDSSFKLGGGIDTECVPKNIPNQLLFCSSASSSDTYFYNLYKEWSKLMFAGSSDHFVADLNCEVVINATCDGKKLFTPLLSQSKVDDELRQNPEKARREFYNIFDTDGGSKQPFKRSEIIKNSYVRKPVLLNEGNIHRKIGIFYDPARSYDNSCVLIVEYFYDEQVGWKMKILNCITLIDIGTKKKIPMRTPEQIEYVKDLILKYNGRGFAEYENIDIFGLDPGSGGGGVDKADYFMEDWVDKSGNKHKGVIDKEVSSEYVGRFPNAVDVLRLISPKKYRTEMFDDCKEMLNLGLIEFPESYDMKGYLMLPVEGKEEIEEIDEITKEIKKVKSVEYKKVNLSWEEELALKTIDLMKEELVMIERKETSPTQYSYDLPADKKSTHHDDRAFTLAMASWRLKNLRRENITKKELPQNDWLNAPIFVNSITL